MNEPTDKEQYLNIADQCAATATSDLAASILVDGGNGTLRQLLNDAADAIRTGWTTHAQAAPAAVAGPSEMPTVPDSVLAYVHAYGDSRADEDGLSGMRVSELILALRRWAKSIASAPATQPAHQQEPASVDLKTMELAESVGLIGPASRTHDLHAAIQRFHDLICANATIKAAQMAAEAIGGAAPQQETQEPVAWYVTGCGRLLDEDEAKAEARRIGGTARAMPLYTAPQADSQPAVDALAEAEYFIDNPSAWSNFDQRASDAIAAVCNAFRAARSPADSVTAPAGGEIDRLRAALVYVAFALHGKPQYMLAEGIALIDGDTVRVSRDGWTVEASVNPARATPAARAADSVLEDAERYRWLRLALADRTNNGKSHWFCSIAAGHPEELDAAIDAARKQGANHD